MLVDALLEHNLLEMLVHRLTSFNEAGETSCLLCCCAALACAFRLSHCYPVLLTCLLAASIWAAGPGTGQACEPPRLCMPALPQSQTRRRGCLRLLASWKIS